MFLFIMFLVYSSSTFDMVMIDNEFMYKCAKRLAIFAKGLSGRSHVSMVLSAIYLQMYPIGRVMW
jgi:hypothetical protein